MGTPANPELVRTPVSPTANAPVPAGGALIDDILSAAFDVDKAKQRLDLVQKFFKAVMHEEEDFGPAYPGSKAIILYRSGGDKLCQFLGVVQRPKVEARIEHWALEGGLPFFHFEIVSELVSLRTGQVVAVGMGSCNSREVKYRYRTADRVCPKCDKPFIRRSNYPDQRSGKKGWYCWQKPGGCNAKFDADDESITKQEAGRVENTEIADLHHTILRVAKKRANGDSIITISRAIGFMVAAVKDDKHDEADDDDEPAGDGKAEAPGKAEGAKSTTEPMCTQEERAQLIETATKAGHVPEEVRAWWKQHHDLDTTRQNIPKALFAGALERFGKAEKLVEAVD